MLPNLPKVPLSKTAPLHEYQVEEGFVKEAKRKYEKNYSEKKKTPAGNIIRLYDAAHIKKRQQKKEKKLRYLDKNIEKLRKKYREDLKSDDLKTRAVAACVALIDETAMRVGNTDSVDEFESFGATTLEKRHATVSGGKVRFKFVGKKQVHQDHTVSDKALVSVLKELLEGKKGHDKVFEYEDGKSISGKVVNRYLASSGVSAKDLRAHEANVLMKQNLKTKDWEEALEETAEEVGHTPKVLERDYLSEKLVDKEKPAEEAKDKKASFAPLSKTAANQRLEDLVEEAQVLYRILDKIDHEYAVSLSIWASRVRGQITDLAHRGGDEKLYQVEVRAAGRTVALKPIHIENIESDQQVLDAVRNITKVGPERELLITNRNTLHRMFGTGPIVYVEMRARFPGDKRFLATIAKPFHGELDLNQFKLLPELEPGSNSSPSKSKTKRPTLSQEAIRAAQNFETDLFNTLNQMIQHQEWAEMAHFMHRLHFVLVKKQPLERGDWHRKYFGQYERLHNEKKAGRIGLSKTASDPDDRRKMRGAPITADGKITIYRAVMATSNSFQPMDYVSTSFKWAKGHAEHQAAVEEESAHVISARVEPGCVFEAPNPGEYFYDGPEVVGKVVAVIKVASNTDSDNKRRRLPNTTDGRVPVYKACLTINNIFKSMDYVTKSFKKAQEHAERQADIEEESVHVIAARVDVKYLIDGPGPGEYFYEGPDVIGRSVQVIKTASQTNQELLERAVDEILASGTVNQSAAPINQPTQPGQAQEAHKLAPAVPHQPGSRPTQLGGHKITSYFGQRKDPMHPSKIEGHSGIDVAADAKTPIQAIGDGVVIEAKWEGNVQPKGWKPDEYFIGFGGKGYGLHVQIKHPNGMTSLYGHMSKLGVSVGEQVKRGQIIGFVGTTGASTGNHTHLSIYNTEGRPVDPLDYIG